LLVDGSNLLFRSWFGFPARIKSRDKARDLTGVFGFFALLRVAVRKETAADPEIMVVFDGELGSAERREADPAYKAHRPADEAALAPIKALPDVKRGLGALGISWTEVEDAEADDVIATLLHGTPAGRSVLIMLDLW
jgi:DNA polymerase-1